MYSNEESSITMNENFSSSFVTSNKYLTEDSNFSNNPSLNDTVKQSLDQFTETTDMWEENFETVTNPTICNNDNCSNSSIEGGEEEEEEETSTQGQLKM